MNNNTKEKVMKPHSLTLSNRKEMHITGVSNVDSFNNEMIIAYTDYGEVAVRGTNLKIESLNVEEGDMTLRGDINSIVYSENKQGKTVFSKIFR